MRAPTVLLTFAFGMLTCTLINAPFGMHGVHGVHAFHNAAARDGIWAVRRQQRYTQHREFDSGNGGAMFGSVSTNASEAVMILRLVIDAGQPGLS